MDNSISGIHHITAIAGNAQRNYDFYTQILGLRLVKKTVNFDDPGTYHFYYGNETGTPGTILTFFPWAYVKRGTRGTGMATNIGYAVPPGSIAFWQERFGKNGVQQTAETEIFGEKALVFYDPDGLQLHLVEPRKPDNRIPWETADVDSSVAIRGFHSITLMVNRLGPTAKVLTDIFGYRLLQQQGNAYRFTTESDAGASLVDVVEAPDTKPGIVAGGTNHHVAFRVPDEEKLMAMREKVLSAGLDATSKIDRNYFFSVYFREPGGVLFELATDTPGFTVDEAVDELGKHLKLPRQYEPQRAAIESVLPELQQ